MTTVQAQAVLVALSAAALLVVTVLLTRRGLLSLRYGLGWMTVALLVLVVSPTLGFVEPIADALNMSPTGLLLVAVSGFLLVLCLQLSISLSGVQAHLRELAEAHAMLEIRLREADFGRKSHDA